METIALLGKGGTAKTTSTGSLAHAIARRGSKVLMIDLDTQASLSDWLARGRTDDQPHVEDALLDEASWNDVVVEVSPNLHLAPTRHFALGDVEDEIAKLKRSPERHIAERMAPLAETYDFCFIDTPRGLDTHIASNVLEVMDWALIATEPSPMSLTAQREIVNAVRAVEGPRGRSLMLGVLPTRYTHTVMSREVLAAMQQEGTLRVFSPVRSTTVTTHAQSAEALLWDYDANATAAKDYETAADEILRATKKEHAA
jgi:chromosome partitioning protein